jgi:hypothetical protein
MNIRKPEKRLSLTRRSDNDKRTLADLPLAYEDLARLAERVRYEAYAKHKLKPREFGLEPMAAISEDPTYCDGHAAFTREDIGRIPGLLRRGVFAGLVGRLGAPEEPRILWTLDNSGWIFEGRITHPGRAVYHGYPLLPGDAMTAKVISRFQRWLYDTSIEDLYKCDRMTQEEGAAILSATQERYRP